MNWSRSAAVSLGIGIALTGCAQVLGADFGDFALEDDGDGGNGGQGGTSTGTGGGEACGNGVIDAGETCDGDCPSTCFDGNKCTIDGQTGDAATCDVACTFTAAGCGGDDGCCPPTCQDFQDPDCPAVGDNVLVVATDTGGMLEPVRAALQGSGRFASVSSFDALNGAISVNMLLGYQAVLVFAQADQWFDAVGTGNALADYHDSGGRVVTMMGANCGIFAFAGRFISDGYLAIDVGPSFDPLPGTLGTVYEPQSYVLDGVGALTTNEYCLSTVAEGADPIADWNTGKGPFPAIARKLVNGRQRVDINMFPGAAVANQITLIANVLEFQ
jgi:hypothetical protein